MIKATVCIVLPYTATAEEILNLNPDGVLLSNGPGNPEEMLMAAKMVQEVEKHVPLFGICMGHQQSLSANSRKILCLIPKSTTTIFLFEPGTG